MALRRLIHGNYYLNSLYHVYKEYRQPLWQTNPLVIYQMGKVGSETLEASLEQYALPHSLYRTHFILPHNTRAALAHFHTTPSKYYTRSKHAFVGKLLSRSLKKDRAKGQWKVISMVRDPVAQNVSGFFQLVDLLIPDFHARMQSGDISNEQLMALFNEHYPPDNLFVTWFEEELNIALQVDVFKERFPHDKGYHIYREGNLDLLILRLENFNSCAHLAMKEFLGIENFELVETNVGDSKSYAALYNQFRQNAVFSKEYVDGVYGSRLATHFYSPEELAAFRSKLRIS